MARSLRWRAGRLGRGSAYDPPASLEFLDAKLADHS